MLNDFKIWIEAEQKKKEKKKPKVKVAHVGASKNIDNPENKEYYENDEWQNDEVFKWLMENAPEVDVTRKNREDDFIDLGDGRDFLEENNKYDIVILHMVYDPPKGTRNSPKGSIYHISKHHNRDRWRASLTSTGAKYIFAFGDYSEISGRYLGKLLGYHGPTKEENYMQVYIKT